MQQLFGLIGLFYFFIGVVIVVVAGVWLREYPLQMIGVMVLGGGYVWLGHVIIKKVEE